MENSKLANFVSRKVICITVTIILIPILIKLLISYIKPQIFSKNMNFKKAAKEIMQMESEDLPELEFEKGKFDVSESENFTFEVLKKSGENDKPILLILSSIFQTGQDDQVQHYVSHFLQEKLISTAIIVHIRGIFQPISNTCTSFPNYYVDTRDALSVMNQQPDKKFIILAFKEQCIKGLELFYHPQAKQIENYLLIDPVINPINYLFDEENKEIEASEDDTENFKKFIDKSTRHNFDQLFVQYLDFKSLEDMYIQSFDSVNFEDLNKLNLFIVGNKSLNADLQLVLKKCDGLNILLRGFNMDEGIVAEICAKYVKCE